MSLADLGGAPGGPPLRVPILSFWHTKFSKRNCLGSPHPPTRSTPPPYGKSWIRHCVWSISVDFAKVFILLWNWTLFLLATFFGVESPLRYVGSVIVNCSHLNISTSMEATKSVLVHLVFVIFTDFSVRQNRRESNLLLQITCISFDVQMTTALSGFILQTHWGGCHERTLKE